MAEHAPYSYSPKRLRTREEVETELRSIAKGYGGIDHILEAFDFLLAEQRRIAAAWVLELAGPEPAREPSWLWHRWDGIQMVVGFLDSWRDGHVVPVIRGKGVGEW